MNADDQEMKNRIARYRAGESAVERKRLRTSIATAVLAAATDGLLSGGCRKIITLDYAQLAANAVLAADALLAELEKPQ